MGKSVTTKWAAVIAGITTVFLAPAARADDCTQYSYVPARYTNGASGDVALTPAVSQLVNGLTRTLGMTYGHASILYDWTGYHFSESTTGNTTPPSSKSTGEPHYCSRVISPYNLQRMQPGVVNAGTRDASSGVLVQGEAQPYCTGVADTYHIFSIKNRIRSGSCAAFAEDECGAQVTGWWQRSFSPTDHYNAAMFLYNTSYGMCAGIINSMWPWNGIGCGGTPATGACNGGNCSACDRAAAQVVNEFTNQAFANDDGWTSWSTTGYLLGNSKTNFQPSGWWWNNWSYWTPRVPDNIYASAQVTGKPIVGTNIAPAYWDTWLMADGTPCGYNGTCSAGVCQEAPPPCCGAPIY